MRCPFLRDCIVSSCRAGDTPYIPSLFQLQEYCKNKDHRKCPFYADVESQIKGIRITGLTPALRKNYH
ncbi:hypothetical protein BMS3Bbin06_00056 [bacterium BMS3Bbin06]|nr:hypothetical protein BMS3Abin08_02310 [bacterium BMS3Abin08]GBE33549.1 hypothetical protein BMS3Bbin06_00056 [bacterium BMS3Bbin06]